MKEDDEAAETLRYATFPGSMFSSYPIDGKGYYQFTDSGAEYLVNLLKREGFEVVYTQHRAVA